MSEMAQSLVSGGVNLDRQAVRPNKKISWSATIGDPVEPLVMGVLINLQYQKNPKMSEISVLLFYIPFEPLTILSC